MRKYVVSLVLMAVVLSTLSAAPADSEEVEQLRREVKELKEMFKSQNISEVETSLEENAKSGFFLAGYAAFDWKDEQGEDNEFAEVKFAPIFHYQYGSLFQFEGEIEFEVDEEGETEVELEYAAGTLFLNDYMGVQVGKFLSPIGQFVQNQHPAWINKLPSAPVGFGHDGAAPTSNVGIAIRGGLPHMGSLRSNYVIFISNAPTFGLAADGDVVIDAEGKGSAGEVSKTWGGRFALNPIGGMEVGISGAIGKASEELTAATNNGGTIGDKVARDYDVFGVDFMYNYANLDLKAEYVQQRIGENGLSNLEGGTWSAWYAQTSYQITKFSLEPVIRYSDYHNPETQRNRWTAGINYLFANNLIAKLAYEYNTNEDSAGDPSLNNNRVSAQLTFGF